MRTRQGTVGQTRPKAGTQSRGSKGRGYVAHDCQVAPNLFGCTGSFIFACFKLAVICWSGRRISAATRVRSAAEVSFDLKIIQESIEQKRWLVMYHDIDMATALRTKEGSFGHTDTTEIKARGGIKALAVNNVAPTAENMKSGKYPLVKELSFVYKGELPPQYKSFVDFVRSADGEAIIRDNGGAAMP